jgi:putative membrane protein
MVTGETGVYTMLKATLACAFLVLAGAEAMAATPSDERFIRHEIQASTYEAEFARLGQVRATRPDVRAYAETLVNDHEAYNGALRELAKSKGIAVPPGMAANDKKRLDQLAGSRGAAFDTAFVREAQRVNNDEIHTFRKEASHTTDPDIRSFVGRFLEVDEKHATDARALSERAVSSRMPVIHPPRTGDTMPVLPPPSGSKMPVISPPTGAEK